MSVGLGSIVCVHGGDEDDDGFSSWIGVICTVIVDGEPTFRVKQLGFQQVTSFPFRADELRETVLTFEGPQCVECKTPYH